MREVPCDLIRIGIKKTNSNKGQIQCIIMQALACINNMIDNDLTGKKI